MENIETPINKVIQFLRRYNMPITQYLFMSKEEGYKLLGITMDEIDEQNLFKYQLVSDVKIEPDPAYEGFVQKAGYTFVFINPDKI